MGAARRVLHRLHMPGKDGPVWVRVVGAQPLPVRGGMDPAPSCSPCHARAWAPFEVKVLLLSPTAAGSSTHSKMRILPSC